MTLSVDEVKKVAHLARLEFKEAEIAPFTQKLSSVLEMIEQMKDQDTSAVEPMAHPLDIHQRLREDVVTVHNQRDALQQIAPHVLAGLYLVPQVIE